MCSRRRPLKRGRHVAIAFAIAVIAAGEAVAQSAPSLFDPRPTVSRNAQTFDLANAVRFTRPPEPNSAPAVVIPPGIGNTGFDSTGSAAKKKQTKRNPGAPHPAQPPRRPQSSVASGPTQAIVVPQRAARAAYSDVYRPPDAPPRPPRPFRPYEEPFDPVGVKVGTFLLKPAIEINGGVDTNPNRVPNGPRSQFMTIQPELFAKSEWARHELTASLRGSYLRYNSESSLDRPSADLRVNGRIDVRRDTKILLEGRYLVGTDYPGSPNLSAGLARLPIYTSRGAAVGVTQNFNRLELTAKGLFDRTRYEESELTDGTTVSNESRDYNQVGLQLRAGYEVTPGIKPFVQADLDRRVHTMDRPAGLQRDSRGLTPRVGAAFELTRILTGEVSIGYLRRSYEDPNLADLRGIVADASLTWIATGLTTVILTAKSYADESILPGVSGALRRDVGLRVDHAFRRWLVGSLTAGVGFDNYVGLDRSDTRTSIGAALTYKFSREFWLKGEVRQDWLRSDQPGVDADATTMLLGVRLQR